MSALREAAQRALEALEVLDAPPSGAIDHYELERRKQALRAALAQEEPLAGMSEMNRTIAYCAAAKLRELGYEWDGQAWAALAQEEDIAQNLQSRLDAALLLEARRQEISQPHRETEQEPVAWMLEDADKGHFIFRAVKPFVREWETLTPLYAAPPRREWQGLTDTDIARVFRVVYGGVRFGPSEKEFAIAIEAKLKEKNA